MNRPFHIANVRLQARDAGELYTVSRMKRSVPAWDRHYRRFSWKRYGLVAELARNGHQGGGWIQIPWPKEEATPSSAPGAFPWPLRGIRGKGALTR